MDERDRGLEALVAEVRVVARQLRAREHALVDDRLRAEARDREVARPPRARSRAGSRRPCARRRPGRHPAACRRRPAGSSARPRTRSGPAPSGRPGRRASRAASGPRRRSCARSAPRARARRASSSRGRNSIPTAYSPAGGSSKSSTRAEELVGDLAQEPRAVARVDLGAAGAAVLEVVEHRQRPRDRLVLLRTREVGNRADAAVVVLVVRVVEASGLGSLSHGSSRGRSAARPEGRSERTIVSRHRSKLRAQRNRRARRSGPFRSWSISRILSRAAIHLCGLPGTRRAASSSLLGLAPGGVYLDAVPSPGRRCALTAPFHPCRRGRLERRPRLGGCFLWHFPAAFAGSDFPTTPLCGVRTFLDAVFSPARGCMTSRSNCRRGSAQSAATARALRQSTPPAPACRRRRGSRLCRARGQSSCARVSNCPSVTPWDPHGRRSRRTWTCSSQTAVALITPPAYRGRRRGRGSARRACGSARARRSPAGAGCGPSP